MSLKEKQLPYNPELKSLARSLRQSGNISEALFWKRLRRKQFLGYDFDRQRVIGNYIVDFYCKKLKLVIELDGYSHNNKGTYDIERDNYLKSLGLDVIHIPVKDVFQNLDEVMKRLELNPLFHQEE